MTKPLLTEEQKKALATVLDYVERWNKNDSEVEVAQAASILEPLTV